MVELWVRAFYFGLQTAYENHMRKIDFNIPSYRITGVTIPEDSRFYICDYDEVFEVSITDVVRIKSTDHDPYKYIEESHNFIGNRVNDPIRITNGNSISYDFKGEDDFVDVHYDIAGKKGSLKFRTLSGDWFCATFSTDGRFLILAEPYDIALYDVRG